MINNRIIVIPFNIPWEWSTDYINQTAFLLSKKNVVICYMWSESFSIKEYLMKKKFPWFIKRLSKNLVIFYPQYVIPFRRFGFVSHLNFFLNILFLKVVVNYFVLSRGVKDKIVWVFHPRLVSFVELLGKEFYVTYDCVDFFGFGSLKKRERIERDQKKLLGISDLVVVNSKVLQKFLRKWRKDVHLVPQGFRLNHYKKARKRTKKIDAKWPVIGFVGAVSYRIDYSLLITLAEKNPHWNFVVWGPLLDAENMGKQRFKEMQMLLSLPNVIYGCSKDKKEIPSIIKQFDIAMIPYDISQDFNRYCYPMKLFEYFYIGKPVVATPIEELKLFPKFVKIGRSAEEWERIIKNLLRKPWPRSYQKEQRKLAVENSWEKKIEAISGFLF